jgi:release factor glutamine methyltransferase
MNQPNESNGTGHRSDEAAWTILRLLSWTSDYFASHDIEHPRADAEILLAHSLGLRRIDLYVQYDKPLTDVELARFRKLVRRRGRREPVAYITGEKEFWSLPLKVAPEVLIPRPETECLVEEALAVLSKKEGSGPGRILDLGTGSGAIILALAAERPHDVLVAVDRSASALAIARENAERNQMASRIRFLNGDWFEPLGSEEEAFDLIVSNPPYIRRKELEHLQPEIRRFEPVSALDGGLDGVDCLSHIILAAPRYLRPSGCLLLEIGHDQNSLLEAVARQAGCYEEALFLKDYSGLDRVVHLRKRP